MQITESINHASELLKQIGNYEFAYSFNSKRVRVLTSKTNAKLPSIFLVINIDGEEIVRMLDFRKIKNSILFNPYWPEKTKNKVLPIILVGTRTTPFWKDLFDRLKYLTKDSVKHIGATVSESLPKSFTGAENTSELFTMTVANWSIRQEKISEKQRQRILNAFDEWTLKELNTQRKTIRFTHDPNHAAIINLVDIFK